MQRKNIPSAFLMCLFTTLYLLPGITRANACYKPCQTDRQCQQTCGEVWYCEKKEGHCRPIPLEKSHRQS